jgi:hypothetical protein
MRNKTVQIIRGISGGGMDIDAQMKVQRDNAEKRRLWEEDFARRKEEERLQHARAELAREKKYRLDSWMSNGGDPKDFERAWPSMQTAILNEKYRSRLARAEDIAGS